MKKIYASLVVSLILLSCNGSSSNSSSGSNSSSSSEEKCSDMTAYNRGYQEGRNNKEMMADCDYFWEMDDDGKMSKECFCKGYNKAKSE